MIRVRLEDVNLLLVGGLAEVCTSDPRIAGGDYRTGNIIRYSTLDLGERVRIVGFHPESFDFDVVTERGTRFDRVCGRALRGMKRT